MDNFEKIEKIVDKAGCSFEDAKMALEACDWDMIDAVIKLEKEGKIRKETAEKKAEPAIEITSEVIEGRYDEAFGDEDDAEASGQAKARPKRKFRLWERVKSILMNNRMVILTRNGQPIIDVPILVTVIALILFFWATLIIAAVAMVFGFRFHFEGEDLGKTNINRTMDKAGDYAEKVKNDLAGKVNEKQNSDR